MERKILSIAPSFNCSLKCEGCYLTSEVSREMREATKDDYYWKRAMEEAVKAGFEEFAMTLNPFPGATKKAVEYAKMARQAGFKVINVTATHHSILEKTEEGEFDAAFAEDAEDLVNLINILTISVDDQRFDSWDSAFTTISNMDDLLSDTNVFYEQGKIFNINLLWTPTVFQWFEDYDMDDEVHFILGWRSDADEEDMGHITIQHLIYKPLTLYESEEWFMMRYFDVLENAENIKIGGDGKYQIGDAPFNNKMGMTQCPGRWMVDIDPMGFVRKCPENPDSFDATNIAKLNTILREGVPGCDAIKCNCI